MAEYYNPAVEIAIEAAQAARDLIAIRKSIEFEQMKLELAQARVHLLALWAQHEGIFSREGFASIEFCEEYIAAGKFLGQPVWDAERWLEEQLKLR